MLVVLFNELLDPCDQLFDVFERTSPDCALADETKPTLDLVKPGRICGCEVRMKSGPTSEPRTNLRMLVSAVVIHHDMNVEFGGHIGFDVPKESQKLLVSVSGFALADDAARSDVEGGEQRCRAVTEIVVRHAFDITEPHGQDRLTTLQGLDLGFFINTQNEGIIRGIKIQTDDVSNLFDKERIGRQGKAPSAVRLNPKELHVAVDGTLGDIGLVRELPYGPVGRLARALLQRATHQSGDVIIVIGSTTMSWRQIVQSVNPIGAVAPTPISDSGVGHFEFGRDVAIGHPIGDHKDDLRASRQRMRQAA